MPKTSPLRNPRWRRPAATARTSSASAPYVRMRPEEASISAGLLASRSAWRRTNGVRGTSGMGTSGYGLRKIMAVLLTPKGVTRDELPFPAADRPLVATRRHEDILGIRRPARIDRSADFAGPVSEAGPTSA